MNLKLNVWRQDGPDDKGRFETYDATDVNEVKEVRIPEHFLSLILFLCRLTLSQNRNQI